jgi:peptide subunit release factor 1 (eRF1)
MRPFLDDLALTEGSAVSLYLPPGVPLVGMADTLDRVSALATMPMDVDELIGRSRTGAALFWGEARKCLILPPFPITERHIADGYDVRPLRSLLDNDYVVALVLVRLGAYSIGICRGEELIDSKTGTGLVHARHKKGGSSQGRFARHREKQIEQFLIRVCSHVREHLEPHARSLNYLVYGGARTTILSLRKQCPFLSQFDDRVLRMLLDIPQPRKAVLEQAVDGVWSTTVMEWREERL